MPADEVFAGSSYDVRTLLYFRANVATVRELLPDGWQLDVPVSGHAAGANVRLTFVETVAAFDAAGAPTPAVCYMLAGIPATRLDGGEQALVLVTGLSPLGGGPYGTNMKATASVQRSVRHRSNLCSIEESWNVEAETASVRLRLAFDRGTLVQEQAELFVQSGKSSRGLRRYRYEQCIEVVHDPATGLKGLHEFELVVTGAVLESLFDGRESLVSVASVPSYARRIYSRPR